MGEGPYKIVEPADYLENYETPEGYNTVCSAFSFETKGCTFWGTPKMLNECRSYVCTQRSYSQTELKIINSIWDRECKHCGAGYVIGVDTLYGHKEICEACGKEFFWIGLDVLPKKKRKRRK
jgi:hypothetical protein